MTRLVTAKIVALALATSSLAVAGSHKLSRSLESSDPDATVNVIVQYKHQPGAAHHARLRRLGATHRGDLQIVSGEAVTMSAGAAAALAEDPDVAYVSPDRPLKGLLDLTTSAVGANIAWQYGWTGKGIGIAVIDSGVSRHMDLGSRVVYSESFVGGDVADAYGHGTHVAGILGGNGTLSHGPIFSREFQGVAPNVNIVNLRALDENGGGSDSTVIAAINRAIELKDQYNIRVINLSLGRPVFESYTLDPLCLAAEAAWKAGIVVVAAAGNYGRNETGGTNGYGTITAPGNDPYVITVGAMKTMGTAGRSDDLVASYSSKGPSYFDHVVKPDIVAPGNRVVSLFSSDGKLDNLYPDNNVPYSYYLASGANADYTSRTYYTLSGTSMATPVVSGAAALLLEQHPDLTPDQVKARLMKTAFKSFPATSVVIDPDTNKTYSSQYDIFTIGAGYLDIAAALSNNDVASGAALSPTAVFDSATNKVSVLLPGQQASGTAIIWGSDSPWSAAIIWGSSVFAPSADFINGSAIIWGSDTIPDLAVIWGSDAPPDFAVIWGSAIIWGSNAGLDAEAAKILINGEK